MLPGCFLMLGEPRPVRAPVGLVLAATTRCPKAVELDRAQLGAADIAAAACRLGTRLDAVLAADLVKDAPDSSQPHTEREGDRKRIGAQKLRV